MDLLMMAALAKGESVQAHMLLHGRRERIIYNVYLHHTQACNIHCGNYNYLTRLISNNDDVFTNYLVWEAHAVSSVWGPAIVHVLDFLPALPLVDYLYTQM